MTKLAIVKTALQLEKEEAFYVRLRNPVDAWAITKWYAKCSECGTENEVNSTAIFLVGCATTQACNACGIRFVFQLSRKKI